MEEDESSPNSKRKRFRKLWMELGVRLGRTSSETRFSALNKHLNRIECVEASAVVSGDEFLKCSEVWRLLRWRKEEEVVAGEFSS
jgi:hypothetical protein